MAASEHGAKIAASRLGITVAEYRAHEAAAERWCPRCTSWKPSFRQVYCPPCWAAYTGECKRESFGGAVVAGPGFTRGGS